MSRARSPENSASSRRRSAPENQPPIKGKHLAATAGGIALIAAATAYGLFGGEGSPEGRSAETKPLPPATASAAPEKVYPPSPIPSVTVSAETQTPEPSPELDDRFKPDRLIAAKPYHGCELSFTSDGNVEGKGIRLNLDLVLERDPASQEMRKKRQTSQLSWTDPSLVAVTLDNQGMPKKRGKASSPLQRGRTSIYLPKKTDETYVVGVESSATSNYDGWLAKTTVIVPCADINQDNAGRWREASVIQTQEPIIQELPKPNS